MRFLEMKRKFNKEHKDWRERVLQRDNHTCVIPGCEKIKFLNAHHLIPNTFHDYEFTLDNGMTLCSHHHTLGKFSAHKNPIWFYEFLLHHHPVTLGICIDRLRSLQ